MCYLSIVVPCFNSGEWLEQLVDRMTATLGQLDISYEILLINDASGDDTWEVIERLAAQDARIRGFDLQFNVGQFRATICGMEHVNGDLILTIDDDLQHAPEDIPRLVQAIEEDPTIDCVIAAFPVQRANFLRRIGTFLRNSVTEKLYGKPRELRLSAFRLLRRSTNDAICAHRTCRPLLLSSLLKCSRRIRNVEVEHHPRAFGRSGYSLRQLASIFWTTAVFGSTVPLRVVGGIGIAAATISSLLGLWYLFSYVFGGIGLPGFATIVLLLVFFGGTTLFALGVLGEYIVRVVEEVSRPPRYSVRMTAGTSSDVSVDQVS